MSTIVLRGDVAVRAGAASSERSDIARSSELSRPGEGRDHCLAVCEGVRLGYRVAAAPIDRVGSEGSSVGRAVGLGVRASDGHLRSSLGSCWAFGKCQRQKQWAKQSKQVPKACADVQAKYKLVQEYKTTQVLQRACHVCEALTLLCNSIHIGSCCES